MASLASSGTGIAMSRSPWLVQNICFKKDFIITIPYIKFHRITSGMKIFRDTTAILVQFFSLNFKLGLLILISMKCHLIHKL